MKERRYSQPFPIMESYPYEPVRLAPEPIHDMDISNAINARMVARQGEIDSLLLLQAQDRAELGMVQERIRVSKPRYDGRRRT